MGCCSSALSAAAAVSQPLARHSASAGRHEPLFFPDAKLPCRNWMAGKECRRSACTFAHEETGLSRLLAILAGAKRTIDVAVFGISQKELADALEAAHGRGVAVRVLTDDEQAKQSGSRVAQLSSAGIKVRKDNNARLHMHHKFAVVDGELLLSGSFNWTGAAVRSAHENLIVSSAPGLAGLFAAEFDRLWAEFGRGGAGTAESTAPARKGDKLTALFFPDAGGTNVDAILAEISAARRSIDVAMFTLTLDRLADALLQKHKQGVRVRVVTDHRQSSCTGADAQRLRDAGLPVRVGPPGRTMHHKFAVVDSSVLVNGSFNWTAQAAWGNQEDAVVYRGCPKLAGGFAAEFERLWAAFAA